MLDRNYYVICDDNCKFEGMTKEQIYDAIAEATGATPTPVDEAFITQIKEQNANHSLKMWKGSEAQYNALEERDTDTVYVVVPNNSTPAKVTDTQALEEIISCLPNLLKVVTLTSGTHTISAQDTYRFYFSESEQGYHPIGVVGFSLEQTQTNYNFQVRIADAYWDDYDNVFSALVVNEHSSANVKCYVKLHVLLMKDFDN